MILLNSKETATFLRRSEASIRNLVLRRAIPYRKAGGRLVFLQEELERWVQVSPGKTLAEILEEKGI